MCSKVSNFSPCPKDSDFEIKCNQCNRTYYNSQCYENHINQICKHYKKCELCQKIYQNIKDRDHVCGEKYCLKW